MMNNGVELVPCNMGLPRVAFKVQGSPFGEL